MLFVARTRDARAIPRAPCAMRTALRVWRACRAFVAWHLTRVLCAGWWTCVCRCFARAKRVRARCRCRGYAYARCILQTYDRRSPGMLTPCLALDVSGCVVHRCSLPPRMPSAPKPSRNRLLERGDVCGITLPGQACRRFSTPFRPDV